MHYPLVAVDAKFTPRALELEAASARHPLPLAKPFRKRRDWAFAEAKAEPVVLGEAPCLRLRVREPSLRPGMVPERPACVGGEIAPYAVDIELETYDAPLYDHQRETAQAMLYVEDLEAPIPYAQEVPPPEPAVPGALAAAVAGCPPTRVEAVRSRGLLLADEQGTGKTRAALLAALNAGDPGEALSTVLVVCPRHQMDHWMEEIAKFNLQYTAEATKSARGYAKVAERLEQGALDFLVVPYSLFRSAGYADLLDAGDLPAICDHRFSYVIYDDLPFVYEELADDPLFFRGGKQAGFLDVQANWTLVLSAAPYTELWQAVLICYLLRVELVGTQAGKPLESPTDLETFFQYSERLAQVPQRFLERVLLDNFTSRHSRKAIGMGAAVTEVAEGRLDLELGAKEQRLYEELAAAGASPDLLQQLCNNPDQVEDAGARVPLLDNVVKRRLVHLNKRLAALQAGPVDPLDLRRTEFSIARLKAAAAMQPAEEKQECPVCYDPMEGYAVTNCGHTCCTECFAKRVKAADRCKVVRCPECREPLDFAQCRERPAKAPPLKLLVARFGSKIGRLLDHIAALLHEDPAARVLLHCIRDSTAGALEQALAATRLPTTRLRGTPQAAQNKLVRFSAPEGPGRVLVTTADQLLPSLNLVAVTHLISFERNAAALAAAQACCLRPGRARQLVLLHAVAPNTCDDQHQPEDLLSPEESPEASPLQACA